MWHHGFRSMAGQPRKRAIREELERRTREFFDGDETQTPLDYAMCLVASGTSIRALAKSLTTSLKWDREGVESVNREMLRRMLKALDEEGYDERMKAAQEEGAHAYAEHSIDILAEASADESSLAAAKSRAMQWYAEKCNRRAFGRDAGVQVNITAAQLMLAALEAPPPLRPAAAPLPLASAAPRPQPAPRVGEIAAVDYEIVN